MREVDFGFDTDWFAVEGNLEGRWPLAIDEHEEPFGAQVRPRKPEDMARFRKLVPLTEAEVDKGDEKRRSRAEERLMAWKERGIEMGFFCRGKFFRQVDMLLEHHFDGTSARTGPLLKRLYDLHVPSRSSPRLTNLLGSGK